MPPKPKPDEKPVPINFRISPKEKESWKNHAKKLGTPLATYVKKEINNNVNGNFVDYGEIIESLFNFNTDIMAAIVFIDKTKMAYKTENWGDVADLDQFIKMWSEELVISDPNIVKNYGDIRKIPPAINLYRDGIKFPILRLSDKYLVSKSSNKTHYLLGVRKQDKILLAKVLYYGNKAHVLTDLYRTVEKMFPKKDFVPSDTKFGRSIQDKKADEFPIENFAQKEEALEFPNSKEIQKLSEMKNEEDQRNYLKKRLRLYQSLFEFPLKSKEQENIRQIEKIIGKKIELIRADSIFETWIDFDEMFKSWKNSSHWRRRDLVPDENFPAHRFKCHMMTKNGHVILISLDGAGLMKIPSSLPKLKKLKYISFPRNKMSHISTHFPPFTEELDELEYLYLNENNFTEIPTVENLTSLKVLESSINAIIQTPIYKFNFPENIQRVDLRENPITYFTLRQRIRDLIDQGTVLLDDFKLHASVLNAL